MTQMSKQATNEKSSENNKLWKGDPYIAIRLEEIRLVIDHLKLHSPDKTEVLECVKWLKNAESLFGQKIFCFLPYSMYDKIWAIFNRIRHLFCRILPRPDLSKVIEDIRGYLSYVGKEERDKYERELKKIEESLNLPDTEHSRKGTNGPLSLPDIRLTLENLSRLTADVREAHWRKINLLRMRLLITAIIVGSLIVLFYVSICLFQVFPPESGVTPLVILAVILFGAMGGAVSALRTQEALQTSEPEYHIQRVLLWLRPIVGAAAGMLLYLIQKSGIVKLIPSGVDEHIAYTVLAFVAGFSERFFVAQIEQVANRHSPKGKATSQVKRPS